MSWNTAHGAAMIAAAQAHEALACEVDDYVDVFGALRRGGVEVVGQKLGGLLGLYVDASQGGLPGCLVNTGLEEVAMRHTAAHELGHHRMGHGTSIDHQEQASGRWGEGWPQHEREAEAFASWFLMPRPAARTALARCGLQHLESPLDAYRMARWLGTPYATTVRHLVRLKMIDRSTETLWLKHSPGSLKTELAGALPLAPQAHVHVLTPSAHDTIVHVASGDCLLLAVPGSCFDHLPAGVSATPPDLDGQMSLLDTAHAAHTPAAWVNGELGADATVSADAGGSELFRVILRLSPIREGSDHFWA
ncbi:ImmA/IrrE family metallo-endopeptidase (plasmid) [Streptomyces laculatispora]|uniref:ImmA/IrrE family metallo-endopeptidase n=1 Tax=Streptomyces laculatispora TaxID=887464 RepID=A0ABY9IJA2_9ACTN|nr:ImmA/IrrE family metallo-endopeptidase [Streptomyces laculatispora]WLQ45601.1 ImmA/IrrE family metallo-endopeptidase [Streptomyces laculatispora]